MNSNADVTLVTGGCGFVGSALCEALVKSGARVVVLDDLSLGNPRNFAPEVADEIQLERVDVRDADGVQRVMQQHRPATVFHLAAIHFIPACDADPTRAIAVNVEGTQNLLTACGAHQPARLVLASTAAVYAPSLVPHRENDLLAPTDIYGLTKLWMEHAAELHHRRTGMPIGIGRLFNVIGRGETNPHLVPEIIAQALKTDILRLGNLTTRRDYIHVDDIAAGLTAIGDAAPSRGHLVCNLGAERAVDGNQLISVIAKVMDKELDVEVDARKLRVSDRPVLASNCARAHELLGWHTQVDLEGSMRDAVAHPIAGVRAPSMVAA